MWLLLVLCVVLLAVTIGIFKQRQPLKQYPRGPRGLPFIGNILELSRLIKEFHYDWAAWQRLCDLYGPIVRVQLVQSEPLIVICDPEGVREFLSRREFDGRPDNFTSRYRGLGHMRGIILNDGPEWIEQKRFVLKALKDFGFGKRTMETLVLEDSKILCHEINKRMLNRDISVTNFREVISIAVLSGLWTLVAGKRLDLNKKDSEILNVMRILNENFRNGSITNNVWQYLPFINYIKKFCPGYSNQDRNSSLINNYFLSEISRHKKTKIHGQPRDLIDTYLDKIESMEKDKTSSFDELQLVVLLKDLFTAGIETTSNLLGFIIVYLATYPNVQTKIYNELEQIVGQVEVPGLQHKNKLPYLNATIAEVSRLANIASLTIAHRVTTNCSILGYDVEKNWTVIGNLRSVHMNQNHWGDAESFRPERFINEYGDFVEDQWLIPFGNGRRKCPGENLARTSLFLFTSNLLQKFRFNLSLKDTLPCLLGVNGFTISPPDINIVIEPRFNVK